MMQISEGQEDGYSVHVPSGWYILLNGRENRLPSSPFPLPLNVDDHHVGSYTDLFKQASFILSPPSLLKLVSVVTLIFLHFTLAFLYSSLHFFVIILLPLSPL